MQYNALHAKCFVYNDAVQLEAVFAINKIAKHTKWEEGPSNAFVNSVFHNDEPLPCTRMSTTVMERIIHGYVIFCDAANLNSLERGYLQYCTLHSGATASMIIKLLCKTAKLRHLQHPHFLGLTTIPSFWRPWEGQSISTGEERLTKSLGLKTQRGETDSLNRDS